MPMKGSQVFLFMESHRGFNQQKPLKTNKKHVANNRRGQQQKGSLFHECSSLPAIPIFLWWTDEELGTLQDSLIDVN